MLYIFSIVICLKFLVSITVMDSEDIRIRLDVVSMLIVGEAPALLRHHLNALGRSKRRAPPGASAPGGTSSKGCLFCLPRNDDGNEFRDYLLEVTLETSWVSDKSTWVVDEAEKSLASWMPSVLRNVDAQLLAKLLVT